MTESTSEGPQGDPMPPARRGFGARLMAAIQLDGTLYEEVEHDPDALGQAAAVVALSAVATALGAYGGSGAAGVPGGLLLSFLVWILWAGIVWLIGVKLFGHSSDFPELLRVLGFVTAPQLLQAVGILPIGPLRGLVALAVFVMTLIAFVRALRQALDVETGRALLVAAIAALVWLALAGLLVGVG